MRHLAIASLACLCLGCGGDIDLGPELLPEHAWDCRQRVHHSGGMCNDCATSRRCTLECPGGAAIVRESSPNPDDDSVLVHEACRQKGLLEAPNHGPHVAWKIAADGTERIVVSEWFTDGVKDGPRVDFENGEPVRVRWYEDGELVDEDPVR